MVYHLQAAVLISHLAILEVFTLFLSKRPARAVLQAVLDIIFLLCYIVSGDIICRFGGAQSGHLTDFTAGNVFYFCHAIKHAATVGHFNSDLRLIGVGVYAILFASGVTNRQMSGVCSQK